MTYTLALLLQFTRLVGRCRECFLRLDSTQQGVLDLLLREAVPVVVPGRRDILACPRGPDLLLEYVAVVACLALRFDNVGIVVERLERVADPVFEIPVLRRVVIPRRILAAHIVDEPPGGITHLRVGADAVEPRPSHRALADVILQ